MPAVFYANVDIIKEFRLRRWARCHYVALSERRDSWHPIVLNEMSKRDLERDLEAFQPPISSAFVPLEPTEFHLLHSPHKFPSEPKVIRIKKPVEHYIIG